MSRLPAALAAIDAIHREDPNREADEVAPELLYAQRMTTTLQAFEPEAGEILVLAARAQHLRRWSLKRSAYPEGRKGYLAWRTELGKRQAEEASECALQAGYSEDEAKQLRAIMRKRGLKEDPLAQTLEDVVCLVFLEHYFEEFAAKHPRPKIIDIVQKTWAKMSERGQQAALSLELSTTCSALVTEALAG